MSWHGYRQRPEAFSVRALRKQDSSDEAPLVDVFENSAAGEAYFA
jgi:hypothetical protein